MSFCAKCEKMYHPDFCVIVDEQTNATFCVWCYTGKDEVIIEGESGEIVDRVSKKEAQENYARYLKDLKDNPKIRRILYQNPMSKIIQ
jgi:hypothetical protein